MGSDGLYGVYWVGQDGNTYVKANNGKVSNWGKFGGSVGGGNNFMYSHDRKNYQQADGWRRIEDPATQNRTLDNQDASTASYSSSSYDPYAAERARQRADEIAAYREAENDARNALGRIGRQREIGLSNINQNYAEQLNQIENDYTQSKGAYGLNTQETIANNRAARERIAEEAGQKADSLRKMFAAGGAGDSSAAQIVAPYAVSLDASKQSSQQQDEYARNRRALDMEFANFSNAYNQNKRKLESEKQNQINAIEQNIENTKMSLNNQIREAQQKAHTASGGSLSQAINNTAGLKNEIRASEDRILDLSKKTPVALDKIAFNAPKLESYADNQEGGKIETGNPDQAGLKNQLDPRLANLLDPNKKKKDLEEE